MPRQCGDLKLEHDQASMVAAFLAVKIAEVSNETDIIRIDNTAIHRGDKIRHPPSRLEKPETGDAAHGRDCRASDYLASVVSGRWVRIYGDSMNYGEVPIGDGSFVIRTPTKLNRILVHFSRGAASAVAWKISVERFGKDRVEAIYCDLSSDEHPDGNRFHADVERWVGQKATFLRHPDFKTVEDCWKHHKFIIAHGWTRCSAR